MNAKQRRAEYRSRTRALENFVQALRRTAESAEKVVVALSGVISTLLAVSDTISAIKKSAIKKGVGASR